MVRIPRILVKGEDVNCKDGQRFFRVHHQNSYSL